MSPLSTTSAPAPPLPPQVSDDDRGPQLTAIYWAMSAVAICVVACRFTGRMTIRSVGADDYTMLVTLILFLVLAAFVTYYASIDGCKHLFALSPEQAERAVKYNWITQPWGIFGFATGKISVAFLILRLIGPNTVWRKWMLYFCMVTVFIINALGCILTFVQCDPPRALWESELLVTGQATCWDPTVQSHYAIFLSSSNIFIDVVLAVLPVTIFYNLNMLGVKKLGLCALLGLGLLAAIAGAVKVKYLAGLNARSDLTWETYNLFTWSGVELFIIIVCGSIPPCKPLYDRFFGRRSGTRAGYNGYSRQSDYPYGSGHSSSGGGIKHGLRSTDSESGDVLSQIELTRAPGAPPESYLPGKAEGILKSTDVSLTYDAAS